MKKFFVILFSSLLLLTACNSTAEPKSGTEEVTKNESKLTLEEVYEKAMERQNELESVSADMKLDQTMSFGAGEESFSMTSKSDMKMDMVVEPLAMYMTGTMSMADPESGEDLNIDMEMYMSSEGLYMNDSETKQWMKFPTAQFEAIMGQTAGQVNAAEQLKELQSFIDEFKFEQTNDQYELTLDAASEKFNEYMLEQMQVSDMLGVGATEEEQQIMENMSFEKVSYVISIDKETFDILAMDMIINMNIEIEGEAMSMAMDTKVKFNKFNEVKSITVPQEVIDGAVELGM